MATFNPMYFYARSSTIKERILQNTKASTLATITYHKTALEASEYLRVIAYNLTRNYKKKITKQQNLQPPVIIKYFDINLEALAKPSILFIPIHPRTSIINERKLENTKTSTRDIMKQTSNAWKHSLHPYAPELRPKEARRNSSIGEARVTRSLGRTWNIGHPPACFRGRAHGQEFRHDHQRRACCRRAGYKLLGRSPRGSNCDWFRSSGQPRQQRAQGEGVASVR